MFKSFSTEDKFSKIAFRTLQFFKSDVYFLCLCSPNFILKSSKSDCMDLKQYGILLNVNFVAKTFFADQFYIYFEPCND